MLPTHLVLVYRLLAQASSAAFPKRPSMEQVATIASGGASTAPPRDELKTMTTSVTPTVNGADAQRKQAAEDNQAVDNQAEDAAAADGDDDADDENRRTLRIAFVGNVDSGKSSLIGAFICVYIGGGGALVVVRAITHRTR